MFDEFSVGKSADVHDIDGHWLARARIDARCLAARPNRIAGFHDGLYRELQFFDAVPRILDLRFQYLRAGGRNEGPGIKAPFMSHIGARPKARICMSGEAIDTRTLASVGLLISKPIEFICALTASGSSAHDE